MAYALTSGFAVTRDEYEALRSTPRPASTSPVQPSPAETGRRIYKTINDEELSVLFNDSGAYFTLQFQNAAAVLKLTQARDLAAVLSGTLNGWRAETVFRP